MARLDARNLICPMPVIRTQECIKGLAAGDELEVVVTDPGALQDFPAWCRIHGHEILSTRNDCRDAGGRATQDARADDAADIHIRIRVGPDAAQ